MDGKKQTGTSKTFQLAPVERPDETAVLADIGRLVNASLLTEEIFEQFGDQVRKLITFDRIRINTVDQETNLLRTVFVSGLVIPSHQTGTLIPMKGSPALTAISSRQVQLIQGFDEIGLSQAYPGMLTRYRAGLRSFMIVPIIFDNAAIGTIGIYSQQTDAYTDHDVLIAEGVASQISGAVANAQLLAERDRADEAKRQLTEENSVIAEIGRIISSSADISEVYAQFGEVVSRLLPCDRIAVTSADIEKGEVYIAFEWGVGIEEREPGIVFPLSGSMTERIIGHGTPFVFGVQGVIESAQQTDMTDRQMKAGVQSFMAVPLRVKNETTGILLVHSCEPNVYEDHHVRLLGTIADQISGAIANAQLYSRVARSEEDLRNSENKLRSIFESTVSGILTIDGHGIIRSLNTAAEKLFGYPADELIGQNVSILMPEPYHGGHAGFISNYLETGHTGVIGVDRELTGLRKDGAVFSMELTVTEVELDGQRSFTGIVRDITARKQSESEVRKLAAIVQSVNDPIIAIDLEGRITVWNETAQRLYGYSEEEALGESVELITPPGSMPINIANTEFVLNGQRLDSYETQKITKSGEILEILTNGSPILNQDGDVIGAVGIHRDLTDQKKTERAARETEKRFNAQVLEEKNRAEATQIRKSDQLQTIFEIAEVLGGPMEFKSKAQGVAAIIQNKLDADAVVLRMVDEEGENLKIVATSGTRIAKLPDSWPVAGEGYLQRAFRDGKSVNIGN